MASTPLLETAILTSRERIAPGFWCLGFRSPHITSRAKSAQYVAIDLPGEFSVRLPLGIWTTVEDEFSLLFREWGDRTTRLAQIPEGQPVSMIGPLGNAFTLPAPGRRAIVVAGGLGVVPFWLLVRELREANVHVSVLLGAKTRDLLVGSAELALLGAPIELCTDDGSLGERGTVLDLLERVPKADMWYGCGPPAMLRALCERAVEKRVPCQISMEETFGCSMGTCWGCVVPVRRGAAQGTGYPRAGTERREYDFARVCTDGTVFFAEDVLWPK